VAGTTGILQCPVTRNILKDVQIKKFPLVRRWWFMPIILATQEAEIRKKAVQSQPGQIVCKTLSQKKKITKKG
jgi:hypothetical protein